MRFLDDLGHFGFDLGQVFRRERTLVGKIVIEAVVDDRTDGDLGAGIQTLHGLGQQMRGRMTQDVQRIRMFFSHDFQTGIAGDGIGRVDQPAIDLAGQSRFGQTGANRGGDIINGRGGFERPLGAVRKRNGDHRFAG